MYDSDRKYLSRFSLDPDTEYGSEDLYGVDFSPYLSCDDDLDLFDNENSDSEDSILEDDFLFGI
ncbi:MAG: hypothetical protein PVG40_07480 [Desulfobacterales bacterium]|jgi:hypothetical protein